MDSLGKYFSELRAKRGISLETIDNDLHFPPWKIKALEAGDLDKLGEFGMMKAMVFNYARYLEADVSAVMAEFKAIYPDPATKSSPSFLAKDKKIMLSTNFLWVIAILVIISILGSIVWIAYSKGVLRAPEIFSKAPEGTKTSSVKPIVTEAPDSIRTRMLMLTNALKTESQTAKTQEKAKQQSLPSDYIPADTTDHVGKLLGKSPINVPIH